MIKIQHFFDPETFTLTYVVFDPQTLDAVIIDPVLNFDPPSGQVTDVGLKEILGFVSKEDLKVRAILETHAHADHLSSSQLLKRHFPEALIGIGERITTVQKTFRDVFNIDYLKTTGEQFDYLFKDFEEVEYGSLKMKAIPTPGHTPACMSYLFEDAIFVGDAIFMPDYGTGRCDFPQGSAKALYHSVQKNLFSLPDYTRVFVGHDYSPGGRQMQYETTIGESKKSNKQIGSGISESEFIQFRESRDKTLSAPRLLLPSIQVNVNAGHLPPKENNQISYLKLPLKVKTDTEFP